MAFRVPGWLHSCHVAVPDVVEVAVEVCTIASSYSHSPDGLTGTHTSTELLYVVALSRVRREPTCFDAAS